MDSVSQLILAAQRAPTMLAAERAWEQAYSADPDNEIAVLGYCGHLILLGRASEVVSRLERAIANSAAPATLRALLGKALMNLRQWSEAAEQFRQVLARNPLDTEALIFEPFCLLNVGLLTEAKPCIDRAVSLLPEQSAPRILQGIHAIMRAELDDALQEVYAVIRRDPRNADARQNLSHWRLSKGEYREAWPDNEWRLRQPWNAHLRVGAPFWNGDPLPGKPLLVVHEQGAGDTIQFARYLPLARARVGKLIVLCTEELAPALKGVAGIDELAYQAEGAPPIAIACAAKVCFPSLPGIFQTTLDAIPSAPYLFADPARTAVWRERIPRRPGVLNIGLVWAGSPEFQLDAVRSPGLAALAPLAEVPRARFFAFQTGAGRSQTPDAPAGLEMTDLGANLTDFGETAAALQCMDLLITSCTSVLHLAGALGVQTWAALCFSPDWRWMWNRSDSPWYPSLRLFRQPAPGDWRSVFTRMAEALTRYALFLS